MALDIHKERGTPLDVQGFALHELCGPPHSKLDDDVFSRLRILRLLATEQGAARTSHALAANDRALQGTLARLRRLEAEQAAFLASLLPADLSAIETSIAVEQLEIETGAAIAHTEPNAYLAQTQRFAMVEDVDHLYRLAALHDRLEGRDAGVLTQYQTDILPGRPTRLHHRAPHDDLRDAYDTETVALRTRLHARTARDVHALARATHTSAGLRQADPVARMLLTELALVEESHLTQVTCTMDTSETLLVRWMLSELGEVWHYWGCARHETNGRLRAAWERMLQWELAHLHVAMDAYRQTERRDPAEFLPSVLPEPLDDHGHRAFVHATLTTERDHCAVGTRITTRDEEADDGATALVRARLGRDGFASESIAAGWHWQPGTELLPNGNLSPTPRI